MSTTSFASSRGHLGHLFQLIVCAVSLGSVASSQVPSVVSSMATAVPHNEVYGAPWQSGITNRGDFVLFDFKTSGTYLYPANGGPEVTVFAPGVVAGGFTDSGIAIDPRNNNLYLNNNYNGGLLMYPFDAVTGTWDLPSVVVAKNLSGDLGGSCGNYFQSAGMAINSTGVLAVATENGCGVEIFTVPVDLAGNFGNATPIVSNMAARAKTVAIDNAGNIYFNEDNGRAGALYIPAGTKSLANDKAVARIDPMLGNVQGVTVDAVGNIYIVDGSAGAYQVPLQAGVPNLSATLLLTTVPASGGPSIDSMRGILFYPIATTGNLTGLTKVYLNRAEFGSLAVGTTSPATLPVVFTFSADTNPYSFKLLQSGAAGAFSFKISDLAACGLTFKPIVDKAGAPVLDMYMNPTFGETAATQKANTTCSLPVTFTPGTVGRATATLQMLDNSGKVLTSVLLHGVGTGATAEILPSTESSVGTGLKTPSQIATDATGNLYVADSGQASIIEYPKGAGITTVPVAIGKFTAPTGIALDPIGNVYVADSGTVLEIPYVMTGVDSKTGQPVYGLSSAAPLTLKTGLGQNVRLAADAIGDLYIADPDNQRYIQLRTVGQSLNEIDVPGFALLSAIATDGAGDVFLASGQNLIEISTKGQQVIAAIPSSTNGLATDHSNAVYVSSSTQTVRIPTVGGTVNGTTQTVIAPAATKPTSVAVDTFGNVFVSDAAALSVDLLSTNGFLNFGKQQTATSTSTASPTIINNGNAPLSITSFGSSLDYLVTSNTCVGTPVAPGATCSATVTFNPGPGDQGTLATALTINGNEVYTPVNINVTGTGFQLANSTTTVTINKPTVTSSSIVVNVTPATGTSPVPTGNVTLTVTGGPLVQPLVFTKALTAGTVTFTPINLPAASLTFAVKYIGDRVYGVSTATSTVAVAQGVVTLTQATANVPKYVLGQGQGTQEPYDGSQVPFYYSYPVNIAAVNGAPLVGIPVYNNAGVQTGNDYGTVTYTVAGGAQVCAGSAGAVPVGADGTAPFGTACLGIDTSNNQIPNILTSYTVTPSYSGTNYASVTGTPVTFIALRNPSVTITSNPSSLTVVAGSKATATLTVTSLLGYGVTGSNSNLNNYSLPVELNCDALPAHATCSFSYPTPDPSSPTSVAVTPSAPGTVVITINTNVAVGTSQARLERRSAEYKSEIFTALLGFGALCLSFRRGKKFRANLAALLPLLVLSLMAISLSACSSANISPSPQLTTPKGTYQVTVTAKQSGSRQVPSSQPGAPPITVYGSGNQMSIPFSISVTIQ